MTYEIEIVLTKGQAGYKGVNYCPHCEKFVEPNQDSVRIEVDNRNEWLHLFCFIEMCKTILEKAGYSSNPSKRDAH